MEDDQTLVAQYRAGQEEAFTILVTRYVKPLFAFAYRLVGEREAAEDIVQETMLKAWKKLALYQSSQSFKTWIFAIARNTSIDYLRKKKGIPMSVFTDEEGGNAIVDTLASEEPLAPELIEQSENAALLEQGLSLLSPGSKELLLLHFTGGMTLQEMADVVGKPLNTVKSQHRRALIALKGHLESLASKGGLGTYIQS